MYLSVSFLISLYMASEHCGQLKTRSHAEVCRFPRCLCRCAHRQIMKHFMQPPRFKGHAGDSRRRMKTTFWLNQRQNLFSIFYPPRPFFFSSSFLFICLYLLSAFNHLHSHPDLSRWSQDELIGGYMKMDSSQPGALLLSITFSSICFYLPYMDKWINK